MGTFGVGFWVGGGEVGVKIGVGVRTGVGAAVDVGRKVGTAVDVGLGVGSGLGAGGLGVGLAGTVDVGTTAILVERLETGCVVPVTRSPPHAARATIPETVSMISHRGMARLIGSGNHAAVDGQYLAGDVAGTVAGEENHGFGHILRSPEASHRDGRQYLFLGLFG